jgi:NADH:ubiquinone oxidoreductase subunit 4 (subunit M)
MSKHAKAIGILLLLSCLFAPAALADGWQLPEVGGLGLPDKDFMEILKSIIDWMTTFIAVLAVIVLIYGGLVYIGSSGDQDRVISAKRTVKYALMGLVIAGIAYAAVNAVISTLSGEGGATNQQAEAQNEEPSY